MSLTAEQVIKEAELTVQRSSADGIEKKANDMTNDLIKQRETIQLEKLASESPLIKLACENNGDFFTTKSFKVNGCLEKIAAPGGSAVTGFLQKMMANNGARNIMVGAGLGAGAGLIAGPKDDRFGSAIKGGLLGGVAGAGVSAYKAIGQGASGVQGNFANRLAQQRQIKPLAHLGDEANAAFTSAGNRQSVIGAVSNARVATMGGPGASRVTGVVGKQIGGKTESLASRLTSIRGIEDASVRRAHLAKLEPEIQAHVAKMKGIAGEHAGAINTSAAANKALEGGNWFTKRLPGAWTRAGRTEKRLSGALGHLQAGQSDLAEAGTKHIQEMATQRASGTSVKAMSQMASHSDAPKRFSELGKQRDALIESNNALGGAKREIAAKAKAEAAKPVVPLAAPGISVGGSMTASQVSPVAALGQLSDTTRSGSGAGGVHYGVPKPIPAGQATKVQTFKAPARF